MGRHEYGGPEVLRLEEIPVPEVGEGQVLVEVRAAGLDRGAWHVMSGLPKVARVAFGLRRPKVFALGTELCGTVAAVGPGVDDLAVGDRVFGTTRNGAFTDRTVAKRRNLALAPSNLTDQQAAAIPISGLTALQAVRDRAKVQPGQRVLVIGAGGGVGTFAVQVAVAAGAEVTAVTSPGKIELARSLGATDVVDYTTSEITDAGVRYDAILDIGGNRPISLLRRALAPKGALVIVGGEGGGSILGGLQRPMWASVTSLFVGQRMGTFVSSESAADLEVLREMAQAGSIVPVVDRTCSLEE
ncbi:MAG: NAD(P)-dependent alcohol dehydrogenase, partial [Ilumatobacteraceae bacterium]|nr:NAD(P)-dependent alcohol dehydrogenase [Ilumatobacteraceae bacterium]